jgi:hypothetical protein
VSDDPAQHVSGPEDSEHEHEADAERRRQRLRERVFGDVLPDTTGDERGPGSEGGGNDEWLRSNVPPHHG